MIVRLVSSSFVNTDNFNCFYIFEDGRGSCKGCFELLTTGEFSYRMHIQNVITYHQILVASVFESERREKREKERDRREEKRRASEREKDEQTDGEKGGEGKNATTNNSLKGTHWGFQKRSQLFFLYLCEKRSQPNFPS